MTETIRILLVDDHPLVREGLQVVLERFPNLSVVVSVSSGRQAIAAYHNARPDVVLMDVNLPDISGTEAMVQILKQAPDAKVLMLTSYTEDLKVGEALDKGAMGFLMKNAEISELVRAIHAALESKHTLSPEAVKSLIQNRPKYSDINEQLTQRELEVLGLIVRGFNNRDIGLHLSVSVSTVKAYAAKIYRKLNVNSRAEAVAKAISQHLVTPK